MKMINFFHSILMIGIAANFRNHHFFEIIEINNFMSIYNRIIGHHHRTLRLDIGQQSKALMALDRYITINSRKSRTRTPMCANAVCFLVWLISTGMDQLIISWLSSLFAKSIQYSSKLSQKYLKFFWAKHFKADPRLSDGFANNKVYIFIWWHARQWSWVSLSSKFS